MLLLSIIQACAGLYIICRGVVALNRMSRRTRWTVRAAYLMLVGGAASAVAACFYARDVFECLFAVGVAAYLACNHRKHNDLS